MIRWIPSVFVVLILISICLGDINMHNPRGSNDRLNENTRDRQNANRLFDSQNNARGGYNVGVQPMYYYAGSHLEIQMANQHSCADQNNNCEIVIQYMCGENIRAGTSQDTPPDNQKGCKNNNCDEDEKFGHHEDFHYYEKCAARGRNKGLFTADQALGTAATSTRQNNGGTRSGYECPEERDYYPYWGPTPWRDIAVLTNDVERCDYYTRESQNVKGRFECIIDDDSVWAARPAQTIVLHQTQKECEASVVTIHGVHHRAKWVCVGAHNVPAPECRYNQWSRDNHQGNTDGGQFVKFDWNLPELEDDAATCILRIRYNISTNDFDGWKTDSSDNEAAAARAAQTMKPESIWKVFGLEKEDARNRQYFLRNNPQVSVFGLTGVKRQQLRFQLAINTAQYGRTFQERSHPFTIKKRPKSLRNEVIHNLNVRGKRGNLQQVFPSTEYDFVPNKLFMTEGEMVHFQWTGANTNPANNAGNGKAGTDRSNIVALINREFPYGESETDNETMKTNYPLKSLDFLGLTTERVEDLAFLDRFAEEDPQLDDRSAYFDLKPQKIDLQGKFYYMCTRNNQFSNRAQKASILVGERFFDRNDRGNSYRGYKTKTADGGVCQRWSSQTPHLHSFTPEKFPADNLVENFCRNPGSKRSMPWCYTTDPEEEWEYCDLKEDINQIEECEPEQGSNSENGENQGETVNATKINEIVTAAVSSVVDGLRADVNEIQDVFLNLLGLCQVRHSGHCYWSIYFEDTNYETAEKLCAVRKGKPASIDSIIHLNQIVKMNLPTAVTTTYSAMTMWTSMRSTVNLKITHLDGTPASFLERFWSYRYPDRRSPIKQHVVITFGKNRRKVGLQNVLPSLKVAGVICEIAIPDTK